MDYRFSYYERLKEEDRARRLKARTGRRGGDEGEQSNREVLFHDTRNRKH